MSAATSQLHQRLEAFPRTRFCTPPTPLEDMPRLATLMDVGRLLIKRDDCTGLAMGGNKVRQLEFYLGEALAQRCDAILITGAVQSNFVRLAAAAAAKLGMACHIQLEERVAGVDDLYRSSGNVLLDQLLGAVIHTYPHGEDEAGADANLDLIANSLRREGRSPYIIPLSPAHKPLGALGYIVAAMELATQFQEMNVTPDEIVVPSGSGNTHAGLLFGLRALGVTTPLVGACVRRGAQEQTRRIADRCDQIASLLEMPSPVCAEDVLLVDDALAPGYGLLNEPTRAAMHAGAHQEGLILDPVYSGKAMASFLNRTRDHGPEANLVFIHTGGTPALFAYGERVL
jgi:D-cysteine desulfhydrase family pyridoxal phosphate-dependent enzyme